MSIAKYLAKLAQGVDASGQLSNTKISGGMIQPLLLLVLLIQETIQQLIRWQLRGQHHQHLFTVSK